MEIIDIDSHRGAHNRKAFYNTRNAEVYSIIQEGGVSWWRIMSTDLHILIV